MELCGRIPSYFRLIMYRCEQLSGDWGQTGDRLLSCVNRLRERWKNGVSRPESRMDSQIIADRLYCTYFCRISPVYIKVERVNLTY